MSVICSSWPWWRHRRLVAVAATADGEALARGRVGRRLPPARERTVRCRRRRSGSGVFLAVVGSLFALFISAY